MIFTAGESTNIGVKLAVFYSEAIANPRVELSISDEKEVLISEEIIALGEYFCGVYKLGEFVIKLPEIQYPKKLIVNVRIAGTEIMNSYNIWLYPEVGCKNYDENIVITGSVTEACKSLKQGRKVLLYPENLHDTNSIPSWCFYDFSILRVNNQFSYNNSENADDDIDQMLHHNNK